ncbi:helix-turn-helix domain-containing protein, partial [Providencia manganoxydans]
LTGKELAMKLNVSQQQISRYERGVCNISIEMVMKYCQVLDISGYELMKELFTSKNDNM